MLVNEKVYYTDQNGTTVVLAANPEKFQLLAKNQLGEPGDGFNATPAVSDGTLLIRSNKHLYCVASP